MTSLLVGILAALAALAVLLPLTSARRGQGFAVAAPGDDRRRELLRQLADLDDDLAQGKLAPEEHQRLREPLERAAAAALAVTADAAPERSTPVSPPAGRPRRARGLAALVLLAAGSVGAYSLLLGAVDPRPAPPSSSATPAPTPAGAQPAGEQLSTGPTARQVAQVEAAAARVADHPRDPEAHVALARAYADAGQRQLSTIEYIAATRLDPSHPEANTALALVAFTAGEVERAADLVAEVLRAHPRQPEALYARGVIELMGLDRPWRARRSLEAYLEVAPYGSHRRAAADLLHIIEGQP